MQSESTNRTTGNSAGLLRSVAEQLKSPLTTIARQAELGQLSGGLDSMDTLTVHAHATAALNVVDSYLLGLELIHAQAELPLEPVSTSSVLTDVAHELSRFAKQYETRLELHIAGKYEPIMAHRQGLRSALLALGYALIEGRPADGSLRLAVHRTPHGIVAGLYGRYEQLNSGLWRRARILQGRAPQPLSGMLHGSGAGLFVADTILQAMATRLRAGKYDNQRGFAATFLPSQQLRFV